MVWFFTLIFFCMVVYYLLTKMKLKRYSNSYLYLKQVVKISIKKYYIYSKKHQIQHTIY